MKKDSDFDLEFDDIFNIVFDCDSSDGTTQPYFYYFASVGNQRQQERTLDEYVSNRAIINNPVKNLSKNLELIKLYGL